MRTAETRLPDEPEVLAGESMDATGTSAMIVVDDVRAALTYLKTRDTHLRKIESTQGLKRIDLSHSYLTAFDLSNGNLSDTNFQGAYLRDSDFSNTNLSNCSFVDCSFKGTRVDNANLMSVTGLRQRTLDEALADERRPPRLGIGKQVPVDPSTKRKLVWTM